MNEEQEPTADSKSEITSSHNMDPGSLNVDTGSQNVKPSSKQSKKESSPQFSDIEFCDKYEWIGLIADEQIDFSIFDTRAKNFLKKYGCQTWGDLGRLTDKAIFAAPQMGVLTVNRFNDALRQHEVVALSRPEAVSHFTPTEAKEVHQPPDNSPDPKTYAAIEWAMAFSDDESLYSLFQAHKNDIAVPAEITEALEVLLATPLHSLFGHKAPLLSDHLSQLLEVANAPGVFFARECSKKKPTLDQLRDSRGVSGERIRQMVAKDSHIIREALATDRFRCVRWAAKQLEDELGLAIPSDHKIVERWRARLGSRKFEFLRWLAGYVHKDKRLQLGQNAWSELRELADDAIGDEWLIDADEVLQEVKQFVLPDVALSLLVDSGDWRELGDGRLIKWTGAVMDKAERIIRLNERPMTPEELREAIGYGALAGFKNWQQTNLIRVDKNSRLAPRDWGMKQYEGISAEIIERIQRGEGVASVSAILEEFVASFGVKEGSVRASLEAGPYVISGDEVRLQKDLSYTPNEVSGRKHAVQIGDNWGQRFSVTKTNLNGYSFNLDRDIAAHNGLKPEDSMLVPVMFGDSAIGEASLIWRLSNVSGTVDVGRLSSTLKRLGIGEGEKIIIVATPTSCHLLRDHEE